MKRREAISSIISTLSGKEVVISSTGLMSRELYEMNDSPQNFYMTGSMGLASSLGLGIAVCKPHQKIVIIEGDASLLMNLGSLTTIGKFAPKNLFHIVLDNEAYGSCSEESSISKSAKLNKIAKIAGYKFVKKVRMKNSLRKAIKESFKEKGPTFILAKIKLGGRRDLPRLLNLPKVKERFEGFLTSLKKRAEKRLIKNFCQLLKKISQKRIKNFSGIGMVLYNSTFLPGESHCDIRPSMSCPKGIKITEESCLEYLLKISQTSHLLHDGFLFINEREKLTHVAQYFVPPIVKGIKPNHSHGIRFRSAQYGSLIKGVITTGIISRNFEPYYFIKGKSFKL